jgi:hypothetical protein
VRAPVISPWPSTWPVQHSADCSAPGPAMASSQAMASAHNVDCQRSIRLPNNAADNVATTQTRYLEPLGRHLSVTEIERCVFAEKV